MKAADQARNLLAKLKDGSSWALEMLADRKVLIGILEAAIPALDREEERQVMISAFRSSQPSATIIAVPDERAERRTLAIAQMAAVLYAATREYPEIALPALNWSVNAAQTILAEAEKRG